MREVRKQRKREEEEKKEAGWRRVRNNGSGLVFGVWCLVFGVWWGFSAGRPDGMEWNGGQEKHRLRRSGQQMTLEST